MKRFEARVAMKYEFCPSASANKAFILNALRAHQNLPFIPPQKPYVKPAVTDDGETQGKEADAPKEVINGQGETEQGARYFVNGQVIFALVERFARAILIEDSAKCFTIDLHSAHFWENASVGALDKIVARLRRDGREVEVIGYNEASADIIDRFALHDKTGVEMGAFPH